jgi:hypothetical protein
VRETCGHRQRTEDCDSRALEVGTVREERLVAGEPKEEVRTARVVLVLREVGLAEARLEQLLGLELEVLHLDERVRGRQAAEGRDDGERLFVAALVHKPTRRLRHEHDADAEDERGQDLDGDRHEPRRARLRGAGAADEVRAVREPVRDHDTGSDGKLEGG